MKKVFCVIGMIAGIWMFIYGIQLADNDWYSHGTPADLAFGADYYTESYSVARKVAMNTDSIGYRIGFISRYLGFIVCGFSVVIICYFGLKLIEKNMQVGIPYMVSNTGKNDDLTDL